MDVCMLQIWEGDHKSTSLQFQDRYIKNLLDSNTFAFKPLLASYGGFIIQITKYKSSFTTQIIQGTIEYQV